MKHLVQNAAMACSLNDAQFKERRQFARRNLLERIIRHERTATGLRVWFTADPETKANLETFIALEQKCCGFLTFCLARQSDTEPLNPA